VKTNKYRPWTLEIKELGGTSGPQRGEMTGGHRKWLSRRISILFSSPIATLVISEMKHFMLYLFGKLKLQKLNSIALVHERTIPTERPPFVGEVNANV
jgi:hypothetical protein